MDVSLVGSQVSLLCGNYCSSVYLGRIKHYSCTKYTDYEILISNSSNFRSDVAVWINSIKLGSWPVRPKSSIRLKNYPFSMDEFILSNNTIITVTFFSSGDNTYGETEEIPILSVVDTETFTININAIDDIVRIQGELNDAIDDIIRY